MPILQGCMIPEAVNYVGQYPEVNTPTPCIFNIPVCANEEAENFVTDDIGSNYSYLNVLNRDGESDPISILVSDFIDENAFFDDYIEYSEGFVCYGDPDFILLVNDFLHSDQLVLRTGDRLKYIPRLKASDLIYEYISDKEKEARVSMIKDFIASNSI